MPNSTQEFHHTPIFDTFSLLQVTAAYMPPKSGKEKAVEEDEEIIQAVVLADSFNSRFKPLSTNKPRVWPSYLWSKEDI